KFGYQLPPPPPPPPPPEPPPPPNPLELPELGGDDAMALERLEFMDSRLLDRSAAWNGALPTYQLLAALVSMPSKALAHRARTAITMATPTVSVRTRSGRATKSLRSIASA